MPTSEIKQQQVAEASREKAANLDTVSRVRRAALNNYAVAQMVQSGDYAGAVNYLIENDVQPEVTDPVNLQTLSPIETSIGEDISDLGVSIGRAAVNRIRDLNTARIVTASGAVGGEPIRTGGALGVGTFGQSSQFNTGAQQEQAADNLRGALETDAELSALVRDVESNFSLSFQRQEDSVNAQLAEIDRSEQERLDNLDREPTFGDRSQSVLNTFLAGTSVYLDNPRVAVNHASETVTDLFATVGLTRGVLAAAPANLTSQQATRLAVGTAATVGGIQEGLGGAREVYEQIISTPFEELRDQSPLYRQLVDDGANRVTARAQVARDAYIITFGLNTLMASGISKLTGAASFEGTLFTPDSFLARGFFRSVGTRGTAGAVSEGGEEVLQSATGVIGQNVAVQQTADETQALLTPEVGTEAAAGLAAGTTAGGSIGLTQGAALGLVNRQQQTQPVEGEPENQEQAVDVVVNEFNPDRFEIADNHVQAALESARTAVDELPEQSPEVSEQVNTLINAYQTGVANLKSVITNPESSQEQIGQAAFDIFEVLAEANPDNQESPALQEIYQSFVDQVTREGGYLSTIEPIFRANNQDRETLTNLVQQGTLDPAEVATEVYESSRSELQGLVNKVLYSQEFEQPIDEGFTGQEVTALHNLLEGYAQQGQPLVNASLVQRVGNIARAKTLAEVSQEVETGDTQEFRGIQVHLQDAAQSVANGDFESAGNSLRRLQNFQASQLEKAEFLEQGAATRAAEIASGVSEENQVSIQLDRESLANPSGALEVFRGQEGVNSARSLARTVREEIRRLDTVIGRVEQLIADNVDAVPEATQEQTTTEPVRTDTQIREEIRQALTDGRFDDVRRLASELESLGDLVTPEPEEAPTEPTQETVNETTQEQESQDVVEQTQEEVDTAEEIEPVEDAQPEPEQRSRRRVRFELDQALNDGDSELATSLRLELEALEGVDVEQRTFVDDLFNAFTEEQIQEEVENRREGRRPLSEVTVRGQLTNRIQRFFRATERNAITRNRGFFSDVRGITLRGLNEFLSDNDITVEANSADLSLIETEFQILRPQMEQLLNQKVQNWLNTSGNGERFAYRNPLVQLRGQDGQLVPEVIDAMTITALQTITDNHGSLVSMNASDIKRFLGVDNQEELPVGAWRLLAEKGVPQNFLTERVGRNFMSALGLVSNNAPVDIAQGYPQVLGLEVISALRELGYLQPEKVNQGQLDIVQGRVQLSSQEISELPSAKQAEIRARANRDIPFVSLGQNARHLPLLAEDSAGVINELIRPNSSRKVSFTPVSRVNTSVRRSDRVISNRYEEALRIEQGKAHRASGELYAVYDAFVSQGFSDQDFLSMFGWESTEGRNLHLVESIRGKNSQLERSLETLLGLRNRILSSGSESVADQDLFFTYRVAQNGRAFINNDINPQGNKIHRAFVSASNSFDRVDNQEQSPAHREMLLAMAQAMDLDPDKKANESSIIEAEGLLASDHPVAEAVRSMQEFLLTGELDSESLTRAMSSNRAGEPEHLFQGIVEFARYQNFLASDETTFTTSMSYEIDGVTNGPFNAIVQMSSNKSTNLIKQLNNGGLYPDAQTKESYNTNREDDDLLDNYNRIAELANQAADWLRNTPEWQALVPALRAFSGKRLDDEGKFARAATKSRGTVTIYNGSPGSIARTESAAIVSEMVNQADKILQLIEPDTTPSDELRATYDAFIENVNVATSVDGAGGLLTRERSVSGVIQQLTTFANTPSEFNGIVDRVLTNYNDTLGIALSKATDEFYADINEARSLAVTTFNVVHGMYTQAFYEARERRRNELIESGELASDTDLNEEQLAQIAQELSDSSPLYQAAMSNNDRETFWNGANIRYTSNSDSDIPQVSGLTGLRSTDGSQIEAYQVDFQAAGVQIGPILTHTMDAVMQMYSGLIQQEGLNIFDARLYNVGGTSASQKSQELNAGAYFALSQYDMVQAIADTFTRSLANNPILRDETRTDEEKGNLLMESIVGRTEWRANPDINHHATGRGLNPTLVGLLESINDANGIFSQQRGRFTNYSYTPADIIRVLPRFQQRLEQLGQQSSALKASALKNGSFQQMALIDDGAIQITNGRIQDDITVPFTTTRAQGQDFTSFENTTRPEPINTTWFDFMVSALNQRSNPTGQLISRVFEQHSEFLATIPVSFVETIDGNTNANGAYSNGQIQIKSSVNKQRGAYVLAHEYLHALMDREINAHVNDGQESEAITQLELLLQDVARQQNIPAGLQQAINLYQQGDRYSGLQEFVAYGLVEHAQFSQAQPTRLIPDWLRKLGERIIAVVQRVLGTNVEPSLYTDLVSIAYQVSTDQQVADSPTLYTEQSSTIPTARTLYDTLAGEVTSPHLVTLMEDIQTRLLDRLEVLPQDVINIRDSNEQLFVDALTPNVSDTFTHVTEAGFNMTEEESLVYRLYAESLVTALDGKYHDARQLRRFYEAARSQITPEQLIQGNYTEGSLDYQEALRQAQEQWNAVFRPQGNQVNTFLANFAALSQTNQQFMELLEPVTVNDRQDRNQTFLDRLRNLVYSFIDAIAQRLGAEANTPRRIAQLARKLVHVKAVKFNRFERVEDVYQGAHSIASDVIKTNVNRITSAIRGSRFVGENSNIRALGILSRLAGGFQNDTRGSFANYLRDNITNSPLLRAGSNRVNQVGEFINELTGGTTGLQQIGAFRRRGTQQVDATAQQIRDALPEEIASQFNSLTPEQASAVTKVLLQTDVAALQEGGLDYDRIIALLSGSEDIQTIINEFESNLVGLTNDQQIQNYWLNQAEHLGKYMVTGQVYLDGQMPNAITIAELRGVDLPTGNIDTDAARAQIDVLATLYAIQNTDQSDIRTVVDMHNTGNAQGLNHILRSHTSLKRREQQGITGDGRYAQTKGYSFDLNDPAKDYRVVAQKDVDFYRRRGYTIGSEIQRDAADPDKTKLFEVYNAEGGSVPWIAGAISFITNNVGGVNPLTGKSIGGQAINYGRSGISRRIHQRKLTSANRIASRRVSNTEPVSSMIASFAPNGSMNSYRYVVPNQTKNRYLGRNTEVNHVLAHWEARITQEQAAEVHNANLLAHLNQRYDQAADKRGFVRVHANSSDPQVRQAYQLIPDSLKRLQRQQTGRRDFFVEGAEFTNVFGHRERSVLELWESDSAVAKAAVDAAEVMFGKNTASIFRRGERGLQEFVSLAKDFIVIRSVVVPVANIISNFMSLSMRGIRIRDIVRNAREGVQAAREYQEVSRQLVRLRNQAISDNSAAVQSRIAELEQVISRNPINPLVEAGLMPTVVEDLGEHNDLFSIQGGLTAKLERFTSRLPQTVRDIGSEALITRNSKVYSVLNEATELGDFVSKFIYYRDLTENQGLAQDDALQKAAVEFIDYGALSGRNLHYLNQIGLTHFLKYFIRIQSVLFSMVRQHPSRVLLMLAAGGAGAELTTPFDGAVWDVDIGYKTGITEVFEWFFTHPLFSLTP